MPSHEQVWFSPILAKQRWANWLRRRYSVHARLPAVQEIAALSARRETRVILIVDAEHEDLDHLREVAGERLPLVRLIGAISKRAPASIRGLEWFAWLPRDSSRVVVEKTVAAAFGSLELAAQHQAAREELARIEREMEQLDKISVALSSTHNSDAVLELILTKMREVTGADAGSIYVVEEEYANGDTDVKPVRRLRFKLSQNDSVKLPKTEMTLTISDKSIAGFVALYGEQVNVQDAYKIPRGAPFKFNRGFDREFGYRTRSLLTLPMKNAKGQVLGVLQLINCKRDPRVKLTRPAMSARHVKPFGARAVQVALSLASQAAVSYENSRLYQDIETLFEGFVQASVTAIEQRDPTTSGHSHRVSDMTCGLAEAVDRTAEGSYADLHFSREQMKEIRYATLLHDFGKVAVREEVLVKAKKLYPDQLKVMQMRFDYVRKDLEVETEKEKFALAMRSGPAAVQDGIQKLDLELRGKLAELDDAFRFIMRVNEPTVMPEGNFDRLIEIGAKVFHDPCGAESSLLTPDEVRLLSIRKGSLDAAERGQIESHVEHTFNFLMQIPWTREIRGIPAIARAHHEKLNGTGYPLQLRSPEIPVQAKIMTICDIFDALAAADRPYKKAVSVERALEILEMSVRDNELDPVLFQTFVDAKIFELLHKSH
jgi:HD-GYP domain-containing protein (c-di-GMP phosphodiesterase class II)